MAQPAHWRLPRQVGATQAVMIVALAAAIDVLGGFLARTLAIPVVYLDSVGTFVAAVVLGPWWGAAAGAAYNAVASVSFDPGTWPFAAVSVVVALLWGYGIRGLGLGRSGASFLGLGLVVAVASAVAASPIVLWVYGGATGSASDAITFLFELVGLGQGPSVFASNLVSNAADKLIAASIGLALVQALPETYLEGLRLPAQSRLGVVATAAVGVAIGFVFALLALLWPHAG